MNDDQESSTSPQPSASATPTTTMDGVSTSTSTSTDPDVGIEDLPSAVPMIAGILAAVIVIVVVIVVIVVLRRRGRRRRRHSFESEMDSHSYPHSTLPDETRSENDPPQHKTRPHSRHLRHSSGTVELGVRHSVPQIMMVTEDGSRSTTHDKSLSLGHRQPHAGNGSTISSLRTSQPDLQVVGEASSSSDLGTLSSHQTEQYPQWLATTTTTTALGTDLLPSSSSSPVPLPPDIRRLHALIQQRAVLLASGNISDKSIYNEVRVLEEKIDIARGRVQGPLSSHHDDPPPYA